MSSLSETVSITLRRVVVRTERNELPLPAAAESPLRIRKGTHSGGADPL